MLGALVLLGVRAFVSLPSLLETVAAITQVILLIHAVEGAIAALLILRYKLRIAGTADSVQSSTNSSLLMEKLPDNVVLAVIKAGLYTFFVGTVGLVEVIRETQPSSTQSKA